MTTPHPIVESIRQSMERHPHIHLTHQPLRLSLEPERGVLVLEGEVTDVASKKLLLELAAAQVRRLAPSGTRSPSSPASSSASLTAWPCASLLKKTQAVRPRRCQVAKSSATRLSTSGP